MRILHDGPSATPDSVNGVNASAWTLAKAQVERGDEVYFLIDSASNEQRRVAADLGIIFQPSADILDRVRPDVIHAHSVFIPRQARLAFRAWRAEIPFVVQPHGGVSPQVLARGRIKKSVYAVAVEKPRFRSSSGSNRRPGTRAKRNRSLRGAEQDAYSRGPKSNRPSTRYREVGAHWVRTGGVPGEIRQPSQRARSHCCTGWAPSRDLLRSLRSGGPNRSPRLPTKRAYSRSCLRRGQVEPPCLREDLPADVPMGGLRDVHLRGNDGWYAPCRRPGDSRESHSGRAGRNRS